VVSSRTRKGVNLTNKPVMVVATLAMADSPKPSRRRLSRAPHACQLCRTKKARCDGQHPCSNCRSRSSTCVYPPRRNNRPAARRLHDEGQRNTEIAEIVERDSRDPGFQNPGSIEPHNTAYQAEPAWDGVHGLTPGSQDLPSQRSQENDNWQVNEIGNNDPLPERIPPCYHV